MFLDRRHAGRCIIRLGYHQIRHILNVTVASAIIGSDQLTSGGLARNEGGLLMRRLLRIELSLALRLDLVLRPVLVQLMVVLATDFGRLRSLVQRLTNLLRLRRV